MADIPFPRGVRDLLPNAALFRNELLKKVEGVFQRYGFLTIDTPMLESLKILNANGAIGEEAKLIFEIKGDELGLRYDQTVSLARYMGMHQELPLPFRRYAIGRAWRRDEPQKGRYREFTQADIDIIGGETAAADAEAIAVAGKALEELGIDYRLRISNRAVMNSILDKFGVKAELHVEAMRIVDKLDKLGRDKIVELLSSLKLEKEQVSRIDGLINMQGTNEEKIAFAKSITSDKSVGDLAGLIGLIGLYGLRGEVEVDFSIVRGLDYYTGVVFEFADTLGRIRGSIAAGGRYDKLIETFGGRKMPAVGASLGIDPILDIMGFMDSPKYTYAKLFVINVRDTNYQYALSVANWFREKGVATEVNLSNRNISNQLSYANSLKFPYAAIIGDAEQGSKKIKLRNLVSGEEAALSQEEALQIITKA